MTDVNETGQQTEYFKSYKSSELENKYTQSFRYSLSVSSLWWLKHKVT